MITFYDNDFSTCAQKVRLLLCEKQMDWETVWLDLRAGDQLKPDYLTLNPNGVVPTIVDNGNPVIESSLILQYLEESYPTTPSFLPETPLGKYKVRLLQQKIDTGLHAAIGVLSVTVAFRHELIAAKGAGLDEHIANLPDPASRQLWRSAIDDGFTASRFMESMKSWSKSLESLNSQLEGNEWLVENRFSIADISYVPYALRLEHLGILTQVSEKYPLLLDWLTRIKQRPAFKRAFDDVIKPEKVEFMKSCSNKHASEINRVVTEVFR